VGYEPGGTNRTPDKRGGEKRRPKFFKQQQHISMKEGGETSGKEEIRRGIVREPVM